jgi:hypothetical protein
LRSLLNPLTFIDKEPWLVNTGLKTSDGQHELVQDSGYIRVIYLSQLYE